MIFESGADSQLADAVLTVHVLTGVVALGAGLVAIATRKGGPRHATAGRLFVATMTVVVVTAAPLAIVTGNWFLLAIAVFSGYLVFGGYRVVQRRRTRLTDPTATDYLGHGSMIAVGGVMVAIGGWQTLTGPPGLAPALAAFGAIGAGLGVASLARLRQSPGARSTWIRWHLAFVGGAYIATVTAVVTVNLTALPPLVRWLGPTLVGTPLILAAMRVYVPRYAPRAGAAGG